MNANQIIQELERNREVFKHLLSDISEKEFRWKPAPEKWNLLDVVCHLYDEEREDFRLRTKSVLENPEKPLPRFDPVAWVTERNYSEQDYTTKLEDFLNERSASIKWLRSLEQPQWENEYHHPKAGPLSARFFLTNWLTNDLLHIRQILGLKYGYLGHTTGENLDYAGPW